MVGLSFRLFRCMLKKIRSRFRIISWEPKVRWHYCYYRMPLPISISPWKKQKNLNLIFSLLSVLSYVIWRYSLTFAEIANCHFISLPDVYLLGTVMLVFGMGLYELFISTLDTAKLQSEENFPYRSNIFGLFTLKVSLTLFLWYFGPTLYGLHY